jgi:hypothetical protein
MILYKYEIQIEGVDLLIDFEYDRGTPKKLLRSRKPWDSEPEITEILKVTLEGYDIDILGIVNEDQVLEDLSTKFFNL